MVKEPNSGPAIIRRPWNNTSATVPSPSLTINTAELQNRECPPLSPLPTYFTMIHCVWMHFIHITHSKTGSQMEKNIMSIGNKIIWLKSDFIACTNLHLKAFPNYSIGRWLKAGIWVGSSAQASVWSLTLEIANRMILDARKHIVLM